MKLLNLFLAGTMAVGFAACSSDEPAAVNGAETETTTETTDGLYATVKFSFPQSRSTASEGEETAKDYENAVNSVLVVTATKDTDGTYKFLTAAYNDNAFSGNATTATYTLFFQNRDALYEQASKTIYLFAYCNPTTDLKSKFLGTTVNGDGKWTGATINKDAVFTDLYCSADLATTWKENSFLMTSVKVEEKTLPTVAQMKDQNSPAKALNLGTIQVIRTAARFDFKDKAETTSFTYDIKNPVYSSESLGSVTLKRAALFNTRKEFYYLPRTNAINGLCPGNDNMEVTGETVIMTPTTASYNMPLVEITNANYETFDWVELDTLSVEDKDNDWNNDNIADKQGYKILAYTTENTLNATNGEPTSTNTTGIVFEAEMHVEGFETSKPMYEFEGQIYPTAKKLYETVQAAPGSKIATAFDDTFNVSETGDVTEKDAVNGATSYKGFTIYRPRTDNKYYCYYYYYNRHNDNGDPATTGSMEFATVRNNVYKLAVKSINKFGTFTAPDPEEFEIYFNVTVEVKPWVVRINDIEF